MVLSFVTRYFAPIHVQVQGMTLAVYLAAAEHKMGNNGTRRVSCTVSIGTLGLIGASRTVFVAQTEKSTLGAKAKCSKRATRLRRRSYIFLMRQLKKLKKIGS